MSLLSAKDGKLVSRRNCQLAGIGQNKPFGFLQRAKYFVQLDTPARLVVRESLTCEPNSRPLEGGFSSSDLRAASAGNAVVLVANRDRERGRFYTIDPFLDGKFRNWDLKLPIDDLAVSPDGDEVVVEVGSRLLRIPITQSGFLELAKHRIARELTPQECDEFFTRETCPVFKPVSLEPKVPRK